jgi:hypothetical protein
MPSATLIESPDEHHWVLLDHRVTQLVVDARSLRLQTWSLDASAEIRLSAPFTLRLPSGAERPLDPARTETLAPALAVLRRYVQSVTATREGELTVELGDGYAIVVRPSSRADAWELHGGGALEGMSYRAGPGRAPWE